MSDATPLSLLNSWAVTSEVDAVLKQWGKVIPLGTRVCYLGIREGEGEGKSHYQRYYLPHCFGTASTSDGTAQLFSRERGGASDTKNPDPYYYTC